MPKPRREIRIALVLYGGVSLAVYMHGVVQELLRFVRASQTDPVDPHDPYGRLLHLINAQVVIDVIAGSSAGGINGVLLGKALACGVELKDVSSLWRKQADFAHLTTYQPGEEPESLLSGAFFLTKLREAFAQLDEQERSAEASGLARKVPALDLFVTTTDLEGRLWRDGDDRGNQIWGRDYTHYFHLRKRSRHGGGTRGYEQNPFAGAADLLARISRATAAIPGVFGAQRFTGPEIDPADHQDGRDAVWLYDGGVLDNRPFRKVIETISTRSAQGPVERVLLYVEPDPEGIGLHSAGRPGASPDAFASLAGVVSAATYQSIHQHIQDLKAHNRRLADFETIRGTLNAIRTELDAKDPGARAYLRLRLFHLADLLGAEVAATLRSRVGDTGPPEEAAAAIAKALRATPEAEIPALLEELDVPFYQRLLYYLIEQCHRQYVQGASAHSAAEETAHSAAEEETVWGALEDLRQRFWQWAHPGEPNGDPSPASAALWEAVAREPGRAPELLRQLRQSVRTWRAATDLSGAATAVRAALGGEVRPSLAAIAPLYAARDLLLFPLAQAGLGERNRIELYRISPFDTPDGPPGARKVTGEGLFHFAAFLDERWRANDLLWGKLDTADILVDLIRRKAGGLKWDGPQITAIRTDLYRRILREEHEAIDRDQLDAHIRERLGFRGEEPGPDGDLLARAELADLQSFFMERDAVGDESWQAPRLRPAVANAAADLVSNALTMLRPTVAKIGFWPLRWAFGGLSIAVRLLRGWVRWALPRPNTDEEEINRARRMTVGAFVSAAMALGTRIAWSPPGANWWSDWQDRPLVGVRWVGTALGVTLSAALPWLTWLWLRHVRRKKRSGAPSDSDRVA